MRKAGDSRQPAGAMDIDVRELSRCTCFSLRRAARQVTQIYDHLLEAAGLTAGQFGLLVQLYGVGTVRPDGISIGALAERVGMDPTTLTRNLKPLAVDGLVADAAGAADRRVRAVMITDKGRRRLHRAAPLWRQAQARIENALGAHATHTLRSLLDTSSAKLSG